jgi:hypothetical protein
LLLLLRAAFLGALRWLPGSRRANQLDLALFLDARPDVATMQVAAN